MAKIISALDEIEFGVEDTKITFLYNTIGVEEDITDRDSHYQSLFAIAREVIDETAN